MKAAFNPILVWFYRREIISNKLTFKPFNPILVWFYHRLSQTHQRSDLCLSIPFWSDFIRFAGTFDLLARINFQSHFGLILSQSSGGCYLCRTSFQSHYGLILSGKVPARVGAVSHFQSHYGLILSVWKKKQKSKEKLSIPLWSDFIALATATATPVTFNPTMVWFYHAGIQANTVHSVLSIPLWSDFIPVHVISCIPEITFQSHYGLILS